MVDKLVIMATHGSDDPERATIPFVLATAAQASDVDVSLGFQADGVWLVKQGCIEPIHATGFPPLLDLFNAYIEAGGKLYVCAPCMQARNITKEDLVEGALIVSAATFVSEFTAVTNVLVY